MQKGEEIYLEYSFNTSLEELWLALTEFEKMKLWYFDVLPDFKAEIGFETTFKISHEGKAFTHQWKVVEVKPQKIIAYQWTFSEYHGASISTFEIKERTSDVQLILRVEVLENFPSDIPEFKKESGIGGWNFFMNDRLRPFLES